MIIPFELLRKAIRPILSLVIPKNMVYFLIVSLDKNKKVFKTTRIERKSTMPLKSVYFVSIISNYIISLLIAWFIYTIREQISILKNQKNWEIWPHLWLKCVFTIWRVNMECENEKLALGRSYYNKNINVSLCFFTRINMFSGDGGVIFVNSGDYSMLFNSSMFYFCTCSQNGGAIYFSSSSSCLRMICANSCSCGDSYSGHFAYLYASQNNLVQYLSISNCSHSTSGYYSIFIQIGSQRVDNTNSSMNNARQSSGICICGPSLFISSHCTFSNNNVSLCTCVQFFHCSGTMSYSNIVHNNSPNTGVIFVNGDGTRYMMYCIFKENHNYLFCVNQGSLAVFHSFIDHSSTSFFTSRAVITTNNSLTIRITNNIQFFNSRHCNADNPLPQRTLEKTIIRTKNETFRTEYLRTFDILLYYSIQLMIY